MFTKDQINAAGRHAVTAAGTAVAILGALSLITAADAAALKESIEKIGTSLTAIATALAVMAPIISGLIAGKSASPAAQVERALNADPALVIQTAVAKAPEQAAAKIVEAAPATTMAQIIQSKPQVALDGVEGMAGVKAIVAEASYADNNPNPNIISPGDALARLTAEGNN